MRRPWRNSARQGIIVDGITQEEQAIMASDTCAHEPCKCEIGDGGIKTEDGSRYCSEGCAKGEGCYKKYRFA